ncbi:SAM-dependent methyltransferase [Streptomyces sp. YIM 98790]|uniref:SAM-dependent methyltransferase n=1 Tax=Streptomyces sp. YIM 98790 TaxID=2689077 RepID=UPI00140847DB|nr:SAM-dependent methyltransferase [Streptomyces sp. YIM 98790]
MTDDAPSADERPLPDIDNTVPHSARIWNYWLGGKDNYEVDRVVGDQFSTAFPAIADNARAFRHFLARAVRYLAGEAGVRQFLDLGAGLPTVDNTHEIAQRVAPESRIVYVDNDPLVLAHARALLTSTPEGRTDYIDADVADAGKVLEAAARTLDFDRPIAVILCGILGHLGDEESRDLVARLMARVPSGSYLLVCDGVDTDPVLNEAQRRHNEGGQVVYHLRSPERVATFFGGLSVVDPGVVSCPDWRPEPSPFPPGDVHAYGGVGRKS